MDPVRKRSASQANLAVHPPFKRRQTDDPVRPLSMGFLSYFRVADLTNMAMSKLLALPTQPSDERGGTPDTDVPGSFPPAAAATAAVKSANANGQSTRESGKEEDEETFGSETEASRNPSPVPTTPMTSRLDSASPTRETYVNDSNRSTPASISPRRGAMQKPILKGGFRHRAHPLKKQHELEQKMRQTKELFNLKRAHGYSQDLSTFRGYMSYREHLEAFLAASDKKLFPPSTHGPESIPPLPSSNFLHRAVLNARKTLDSPRPVIPRFTKSELIARQLRERDEQIERRLRPKLPDSLPPEDEQIVRNSLSNRSFLAKAAREQVSSQDLIRLRPGQWLNDEIINFYGAMISERAAKFEKDKESSKASGTANGTPSLNGKGKARAAFPSMEGVGDPWKVHVFNTFFLPKLQDMGYEKARLNKWTKKIDIFSKDIVLIPCNLGNSHWTCAAINFRDKRIEYYDSMGMDRPSIRHSLRSYLDLEHRDKKGGAPFDFTGWEDFFTEDSPQQENGYDCGVFLCQTMENLSRGVPIPFDFTQQNMPYLRRRMIFEITAEQLSLKRL